MACFIHLFSLTSKKLRVDGICWVKTISDRFIASFMDLIAQITVISVQTHIIVSAEF